MSLLSYISNAEGMHVLLSASLVMTTTCDHHQKCVFPLYHVLHAKKAGGHIRKCGLILRCNELLSQSKRIVVYGIIKQVPLKIVYFFDRNSLHFTLRIMASFNVHTHTQTYSLLLHIYARHCSQTSTKIIYLLLSLVVYMHHIE